MLSLSDPAKNQELIQANALAAIMITDADTIQRATAKLCKKKKIEVPMSMNPALPDVQNNALLYIAVLFPNEQFNYSEACQRAATITLGLAARYNLYTSGIVAEATTLITGIPQTLQALHAGGTKTKGIFDVLMPTLETVQKKIEVMEKRLKERQQRGGNQGRGNGSRRRGGGYRYNGYRHPYHNYGPYQHGQHNHEEEPQHEQEQPEAKRGRVRERGRGGRGGR